MSDETKYPPIIRDQWNRCIHCRRFICLVFHWDNPEAVEAMEQQEEDDFMSAFLL